MAERVTFPSSTGPTLAGIIDRPVGTPRGWGVFSHGFTLGKDSPAAARICKGDVAVRPYEIDRIAPQTGAIHRWTPGKRV